MFPLGVFGSLGFQELLIILLIVVFLFGARRIPEIARGLGEGIRGFRSAVRDPEKGDRRNEHDDDGGGPAPRGPAPR